MGLLTRWSGTVLVAAGEPGAEPPEKRPVRYAVLRGTRVVRQGACTAGELERLGGWQLRASFFSRGAYFERIPAQAQNRRLAEVVARRHIDNEMLFSEPFRLRLGLLHVSEADVQLRTAACAELDCMRIESALPLETRPVRLLALEENAVASLVARITREPVLALFARGDRFLALVVEAGEVRQRRLETLGSEPDAGLAAAQRAEATMMGLTWSAGAALGAEAKEVALSVRLGELCASAEAADTRRDTASRALEKRIEALFLGGSALAEPELYGLAFADKTWNLLEPAQAHRALAWQVALPVSLAVGGAALAASLAAGADMAGNSALARGVASLRERVTAENEALTRRVPGGAEMARFSELTGLLSRRTQQVRIDRFLSWVSAQMPRGVTVTSLAMMPLGAAMPDEGAAGRAGKTAQGRPTNKRPITAVPRDQEYRLHLALSIPGNYEAVERQTAEIVERLGHKTRLSGGSLHYEAGASRASFDTQLIARAEDFR